jgi:hypothetical protein
MRSSSVIEDMFLLVHEGFECGAYGARIILAALNFGKCPADRLLRLGVYVVKSGPLQAASLPPVPSPPSRCNLDVTTLCGLVSEVSHTAGSPEVQAWAARVSHWRVRVTSIC